MNSTELYERNRATGSDINSHLETLYKIGCVAKAITEFGVRGGNSTSAWLHAKPEELRCYDIAVPADLPMFERIAIENKIRFYFTRIDTKQAVIAPTDILFLDTLHNSEQLTAELKNHVHVRQRIVLHDTETNGWVGEAGGGPLKQSIIEFLLAHPEWRIESHTTANNGLTILVRVLEAKQLT